MPPLADGGKDAARQVHVVVGLPRRRHGDARGAGDADGDECVLAKQRGALADTSVLRRTAPSLDCEAPREFGVGDDVATGDAVAARQTRNIHCRADLPDCNRQIGCLVLSTEPVCGGVGRIHGIHVPNTLVARPDIRGRKRRVGERCAVADRERRAIPVVAHKDPDERFAIRVPRVDLVGKQASVGIEYLETGRQDVGIAETADRGLGEA